VRCGTALLAFPATTAIKNLELVEPPRPADLRIPLSPPAFEQVAATVAES
jgi:hypothetical protein